MAGSGTQQDPFQVATYEDLCKVGTGIDGWNLDSYYIQTENIQCPTGENRHNFVPIGSYGNPFTGQYDGNNKTIKNLYIDRGDTDDIGLFGCAFFSVLKNISLLNVNITGRYRCGALVGYITGAGARVDNCNSSGIIYGTFGTVGGLIGAVSSWTGQDNTIIINSHSSVTVESEGERVGGFAGQFWTDVMVDNCYATGNVTGMRLIGGFVGIMSTANAIDCYATGAVEGGENTGGFAGKLQVSSTVENCYAIGNVTGTGLTGGFAGFISTTNATNCYAEGEVEGGESTGGFVGQLQNSSIVENCYATGAVEGGENTGGFAGNFILESTTTNCYATGAVEGGENTGGFAGFMSTNAINCYAEGSVNSNGNPDTGGFVGFMSNANTIDCYAEGEVTGIECTGGFAGIMSSSANAINCYAEGEVTGTQYTGGFAGQLQNSSIVENCYTTGDVNGGKRTGGFVGNFISESTTTNCYATGAVEGGENTGGFAGIMFTANAINCYAEGSVNSNGNPDTGGFVGQLQISSTVENCYATGAVEGGENTGGFAGNVSSDSVVLYCFWDINTSGQIASAGGTGKTTAEMQSVSTFANWNIVSIDNFNRDAPTIWFIDDGNDYPRLGWEYVPEFAIRRFKVCVDNANRLVKTSKYGVNNVWRNIKEIKCGVSNAWRSVWKRAVELIRIFITKADFNTCTLTNTVVTAAGDVELAKQQKAITPLDIKTDWIARGSADTITQDDNYTLYVKNFGHDKGAQYKNLGISSGNVVFYHTLTDGNGSYNTSNGHAVFRIRTNSVTAGDYYNDDTFVGWEVYNPSASHNYVLRSKGMDNDFNLPLYTGSSAERIKFEIMWDETQVLVKVNDGDWVTQSLDGLNFSGTYAELGYAIYNGTVKWQFVGQDVLFLPQGTAESPAIDLSPAGAAETSEIEFTTTTVDMGKALSFDGVDDYVEIAHNSILNGTIPMTLECWAFIENSEKMYLFCKRGTGTGNTGFSFWAYEDSGNIQLGHVKFGVVDQKVTSNVPFEQNKWYHFAVVQTNSEALFYIDGEFIGSYSNSSAYLAATNPLYLGVASAQQGITEYAKGRLKEMRKWNTARTQQQIQDNMFNELTGNEAGLVGYWKLNEGTGTTANDSTSNNNDGTISGASWTDGRKTTVTLQTALSTDGGANWGNWQTATSGAAIPGLTAGDDVSNTKMKWKATLSTNDAAVTPKLRNVIVKLNKGM